jgi:hypothetical protein
VSATLQLVLATARRLPLAMVMDWLEYLLAMVMGLLQHLLAMLQLVVVMARRLPLAMVMDWLALVVGWLAVVMLQGFLWTLVAMRQLVAAIVGPLLIVVMERG